MAIISIQDFNKVAGVGSVPGLTGLLMRTMKIDAFNRMMDEAEALRGVTFADHLLRTLGITVSISDADLQNIPKDGSFIAIANHPYGAIESLALLSLLVKKRPETMFMGNFLLKKVPNLADHIIAVNPFENIQHSSSISGIKNTLASLKSGVPVAIFPAGEVSSYCFKNKQVTDKEWHPVVGKIITKANLPVLPIYFHGNNGNGFGLLRHIHPSLQTAMLFTELFNKKGHCLRVRIGKPILPGELADVATADVLGYVRQKTYGLGELQN